MPLWKLTAWPNITGKQITVDITAWCFPSLFPGSAAGIRKVTQKLYRGRIIGLESTKKRKLKENSIKAVGLKANRTEWEEVLPNRANTLPTDRPNSEKWPAQFRNRFTWDASRAAGIRRIREESTAAPCANTPSLPDLHSTKILWLLKWWRHLWRPESKLLLLLPLMLDLEMWSVTSALGENSKLWSPVWIVCCLTVKLTLEFTMMSTPEENTQWLMPQASYRRGSALIIRRFLKYFVEPIRVVSAICARWTNIKAMTQSLLQQNGQTNRSVLELHVCPTFLWGLLYILTVNVIL